MKSKLKRRHEIISQPTRLFLDDLEKLQQVFSETQDVVSVETEDYEFDGGVQTLAKNNTGSLTNLRFIGYTQHLVSVILFLGQSSIQVVLIKDDIESLGVLEKIKTIIYQRRIPLLLSQPVNAILSGCILGGLVSLTITSVVNGDYGGAAISGVLSLLASVWAWWAIFRQPKNTIVLKYEIEASTFLRRHSETIIVSAISSLVTLLLGYILGQLLGVAP